MNYMPDISQGPFWKLIGMKLVGTCERGCVLELKVSRKNLHAFNRVHGGVIASLIDSAIGFAAHKTISSNVGANTCQLSINYIRPVEIGEVIRARSDLIHCGMTTIFGICKVENSKGENIAYGTATMIVKPVNILYKKKVAAQNKLPQKRMK